MVPIATEVGVAYVRLIPTMKGFSAQAQAGLTKGVVGPAAAAGSAAGSRIGTGIATGVRSGAASAAGSIRERISTGVAGASAAVGGLGASFKGMAATAGAALAAIGIANIGREIFTVATTIQDTRASLTGLYGDASLAADTVAQINDEFARSPIGAQAFQDAAVSLGYLGVQGDDAVGMLQNIDIAVQSLKGGPAQIDSITSALTKTLNQGNAFNSELNMISEAGFPIFEELAAHLDTTSGEIKEMASEGEISLEHLLAVLGDPTEESFQRAQAAAEETGRTFSGAFQAARGQVITSLGEMLVPLLDRFAPAVESIGGAIETGLGKLPGLLSDVGASLQEAGVTDAVVNIATGIKDFAVAAMPAVKGFAIGFVGAISAALIVLSPLGDLLSRLAGIMASNAGAVQVLGGALGALVGAAVAIGVVMRIATAAMAAFRVVAMAVRTVMLLQTAAIAIWRGLVMAIRAVTIAWTAVQWLLNAALLANPIGLIILAIIALIAIIALVIVYWDEIVAAVVAAWEWIKSATSAAVSFLGGLISSAGAAISAAWSAAWSWIAGLARKIWARITGFVRSGIQRAQAVISAGVARIRAFIARLAALPGMVRSYFVRMARAAIARSRQLVNFVRSIPGRIKSALGNLGNLLRNAGRRVIQGLINGIKSMIGSVGSAMSGIASTIRGFLPFSPAKIGPLSGSGSPDRAGATIGQMVAAGMSGSLGLVAGASTQLAATTMAGTHLLDARTGAGAAPAAVVEIDGTGLPRALEQWLRHAVRTKGHGSVQAMLGQ